MSAWDSSPSRCEKTPQGRHTTDNQHHTDDDETVAADSCSTARHCRGIPAAALDNHSRSSPSIGRRLRRLALARLRLRDSVRGLAGGKNRRRESAVSWCRSMSIRFGRVRCALPTITGLVVVNSLTPRHRVVRWCRAPFSMGCDGVIASWRWVCTEPHRQGHTHGARRLLTRQRRRSRRSRPRRRQTRHQKPQPSRPPVGQPE